VRASFHASAPEVTVRLVIVCVVALACLPACNRRVFTEVEESCDSTIAVDVAVPAARAADILIVVDNSGSMQEEQDRLAQNFFNLDATQCPLTDLAHIDPQFENPSPDLYTGTGPLAQCGFIQLLAAFDNDFRVGVITTDVGLADNRFGFAPAGWGFHPERGCLQPDGNPAAPGVRKVLSRADLFDDDDTNDNLAQRFADTLKNVATWGSPYERGLDAVNIFLDPSATRAGGCDNDLASFRRPDAQLDVIFLSDEDDCSHGLASAPPFDELAGEPGPGIDEALYGVPAPNGPDRCYDDEASLPAVALYADKLKQVDATAKVVVIAGLLPDASADGGFVAGGCLAGDPPGDQCFASHGNSNDTDAGEVCAPGAHSQACCVADEGSRYLAFAQQFESSSNKAFLADSICNTHFKDTMLDVAAFLGATNFVDLAEPPKDGEILITETRRGSTSTLTELSADECTHQSGFTFTSPTRVLFCGTAVPGPGDDLSIRAKGQAATPSCAEASGSGPSTGSDGVD
jgi:hypothetical protein